MGHLREEAFARRKVGVAPISDNFYPRKGEEYDYHAGREGYIKMNQPRFPW